MNKYKCKGKIREIIIEFCQMFSNGYCGCMCKPRPFSEITFDLGANQRYCFTRLPS